VPRFQQTFSSKGDGRKARHLLVRRLWWYQTVSAALGLDAPHDIGKVITPQRYRIEGVSHVYRSDWSMYGRGLRSPSTSTLSQVDHFVPGSSATFNHNLWRFLAPNREARRSLPLRRAVDRRDAGRLLETEGCVKIDTALRCSPLDAVAMLLKARQIGLEFGYASAAKHAEVTLLRACIVFAAVDRGALPFVDLIALLNEWLSRQSTTTWPFFSVTTFAEIVRTIRQCKPRNGGSFWQVSDASRKKTAMDALKGRFGIDIALTAQPIYLCSCQRECRHAEEARQLVRPYPGGCGR